jgi:glycerate 2-kinase
LKPDRSSSKISLAMEKSKSASQARSDLMRIFAAAVAAVAPDRVIARALEGGIPEFQDVPAIVSEAPAIKLLAVGKAAIGMAASAHARTGTKLVEGLIIAPMPPAGTIVPPGFRLITAAHPLPDGSSEVAGRSALEFVSGVGSGELLLLLLSGGASALMCAPPPGITLADKIAVTASLLRSGATIGELNTVRKHLSEVKGGGLLRRLRPDIGLLSLILSDVPGNDLATIGSGPTVADPTSFADAIGVLKRRKLWGRTPEAVRDRLERGNAGAIAETMKVGDEVLARAENVIVGDNAMALEAAGEAALALGYTVQRWQDFGYHLNRDAETVGRDLALHLRGVSSERVCVIAGGEPVVTVRGNGRGGRAQHCALATAIGLDGGDPKAHLCALFAGTDGIDGPTDAAGAIITPTTVARGREARLDAPTFLARNDAYAYFKALGDLLIIGATGTNVADIFVGLVGY